ncbi:MAG: cytochrome d ubiquinol oxidase subunit II [Chlamydiae bacterium]|nr:cytochrome d ubiquinol oxidase subunit II [Chlamydiota bacterium]
MTHEILQVLWYMVVGASVIFYVMLDGFDLGVGSIHYFARTDHDRRIFLNSIGPFWDGNEVWLIVIGGSLFVGFPDVYAVSFSGFYNILMILLAGIIARVCGIEFRSKYESKKWKALWDTVFCLSSLAMTFGIGVILGNLVQGVPIDGNREMNLPFWSLFTPYTVGIGILSIGLFAMHGNNFLLMKTEGELQNQLRKLAPYFILAFSFLLIAMTLWTWYSHPYMVERYFVYPFLFLVPVMFFTLLGLMTKALQNFKYGLAFIYSMLSIAFLFSLFAIGTFPNVMISSLNKELYSLTVFNASASLTTLKVACTIAVIGVPLVLAYGFCLYYIFHGKTKLHDHSY